MTLGSIAISTIYLAYRATTLGDGWLLVLSIPLFAAEIWALTQLVSLAHQAWHRPATAPRERPVDEPIDIVIGAHAGDTPALERSLIATSLMPGRGRAVVVDAAYRVDRAALADRFGAGYEPDRRLAIGDVAAAIHDHASSDLYLWLDAGQVPSAGLLPSMIGWFDDPRIALCQSAVGAINPDSLAHVQRGRDEDALEREVLAPGLARRGFAPWHGPGSIVRRAAIDEVTHAGPGVGGLDRTATRLRAAGWRTAYDPRTLVRAVAPDTLDDYLARRRDRAARNLRRLRPTSTEADTSRRPLAERLAAFESAAMYGTGIRHALVVSILVACLVFGEVPTAAPLLPLLSLFALSTGLSIAARRALARGSMRAGDWTRHGWRTLGADVAAIGAVLRLRTDEVGADARPHTGIRALGRLGLLTSLVVALDVALLLRAATIIDADLLPSTSNGVRIVLAGAALIALAPMIDVLQLVALRRQRRRTFRVPTRLDVELGEYPARTLDITPLGVGVLMGFSPAVGTSTPIRLHLPAPGDPDRWIRGTAVVRAATAHATGLVRVGLEFGHLHEDARLALVEYCLRAGDDHSRSADAADRASKDSDIDLTAPDVLDVRHDGRHRRPVAALTAAAIVAGTLTVGASPVLAAETTTDPTTIEQVCVEDSDGVPQADTTVEVPTADGDTSIATTDESGCVEVEPLDPDAAAEAVVEAVPEESTPQLEGATATFTVEKRRVQLVSTEDTGVSGAKVRYHDDGVWYDAGTTDATGGATVVALSPDTLVEVTWRGARLVAPLESDGALLALARIDDGGAGVSAIDRGQGWEPFHDGIQVAPGRIALRLSGGGVVKTIVDPAHAYDVAADAQVALTPAPAEVSP